jgi:hypothetical protein
MASSARKAQIRRSLEQARTAGPRQPLPASPIALVGRATTPKAKRREKRWLEVHGPRNTANGVEIRGGHINHTIDPHGQYPA